MRLEGFRLLFWPKLLAMLNKLAKKDVKPKIFLLVVSILSKSITVGATNCFSSLIFIDCYRQSVSVLLISIDID